MEAIDNRTALAFNRAILHNEATRVLVYQGSAKDSLEKGGDKKNNENHFGIRECNSCCGCRWFSVLWS